MVFRPKYTKTYLLKHNKTGVEFEVDWHRQDREPTASDFRHIYDRIDNEAYAEVAKTDWQEPEGFKLPDDQAEGLSPYQLKQETALFNSPNHPVMMDEVQSPLMKRLSAANQFVVKGVKGLMYANPLIGGPVYVAEKFIAKPPEFLTNAYSPEIKENLRHARDSVAKQLFDPLSIGPESDIGKPPAIAEFFMPESLTESPAAAITAGFSAAKEAAFEAAPQQFSLDNLLFTAVGMKGAKAGKDALQATRNVADLTTELARVAHTGKAAEVTKVYESIKEAKTVAEQLARTKQVINGIEAATGVYYGKDGLELLYGAVKNEDPYEFGSAVTQLAMSAAGIGLAGFGRAEVGKIRKTLEKTQTKADATLADRIANRKAQADEIRFGRVADKDAARVYTAEVERLKYEVQPENTVGVPEVFDIEHWDSRYPGPSLPENLEAMSMAELLHEIDTAKQRVKTVREGKAIDPANVNTPVERYENVLAGLYDEVNRRITGIKPKDLEGVENPEGHLAKYRPGYKPPVRAQAPVGGPPPQSAALPPSNLPQSRSGGLQRDSSGRLVRPAPVEPPLPPARPAAPLDLANDPATLAELGKPSPEAFPIVPEFPLVEAAVPSPVIPTINRKLSAPTPEIKKLESRLAQLRGDEDKLLGERKPTDLSRVDAKKYWDIRQEIADTAKRLSEAKQAQNQVGTPPPTDVTIPGTPEPTAISSKPKGIEGKFRQILEERAANAEKNLDKLLNSKNPNDAIIVGSKLWANAVDWAASKLLLKSMDLVEFSNEAITKLGKRVIPHLKQLYDDASKAMSGIKQPTLRLVDPVVDAIMNAPEKRDLHLNGKNWEAYLRNRISGPEMAVLGNYLRDNEKKILSQNTLLEYYENNRPELYTSIKQGVTLTVPKGEWLAENTNRREILLKDPESEFIGKHYPTSKGVDSWAMVSDDQHGRLTIEQVQSDKYQGGNDKSAWHKRTVNHVIKYALENGYTEVVYTPRGGKTVLYDKLKRHIQNLGPTSKTRIGTRSALELDLSELKNQELYTNKGRKVRDVSVGKKLPKDPKLAGYSSLYSNPADPKLFKQSAKAFSDLYKQKQAKSQADFEKSLYEKTDSWTEHYDSNYKRLDKKLVATPPGVPRSVSPKEAEKIFAAQAELSNLSNKLKNARDSFEMTDEQAEIMARSLDDVMDTGTIRDKEDKLAFRHEAGPTHKSTYYLEISEAMNDKIGAAAALALQELNVAQQKIKDLGVDNPAANHQMQMAKVLWEDAVKNFRISHAASSRVLSSLNRQKKVAKLIKAFQSVESMMEISKESFRKPIWTSIHEGFANYNSLTVEQKKKLWFTDLSNASRLAFSYASVIGDLTGNNAEIGVQLGGRVAHDLVRGYTENKWNFIGVQGFFDAIGNRYENRFQQMHPRIEAAFAPSVLGSGAVDAGFNLPDVFNSASYREALDKIRRKPGAWNMRGSDAAAYADVLQGAGGYLKIAADKAFGKQSATSVLFMEAHRAADNQKLLGAERRKFINNFIENPPDPIIDKAIEYGLKAKFNRPISKGTMLHAFFQKYESTPVKMLVDPYASWALNATIWMAEMMGLELARYGINSGKHWKGDRTLGKVTEDVLGLDFKGASTGKSKWSKLSAPEKAEKVSRMAIGWGTVGLLASASASIYNAVNFKTMKLEDPESGKTYPLGVFPMADVLTTVALLKAATEKDKIKQEHHMSNFRDGLKYMSLPGVKVIEFDEKGKIGVKGGGILGGALETFARNTSKASALKALGELLSRPIPMRPFMELVEGIIDPTQRTGIAKNIPGLSEHLAEPRIDLLTGKPMMQSYVLGSLGELTKIPGLPLPVPEKLSPIQVAFTKYQLPLMPQARTELNGLVPDEWIEDWTEEFHRGVGEARAAMFSNVFLKQVENTEKTEGRKAAETMMKEKYSEATNAGKLRVMQKYKLKKTKTPKAHRGPVKYAPWVGKPVPGMN